MTLNGEDLNGTVALVTRASAGTGGRAAGPRPPRGAAVVIPARRKDRLDERAARIGDAGGRVLAVEADVTARGQAEELIGRTVGELGRLDTLANKPTGKRLGP